MGFEVASNSNNKFNDEWIYYVPLLMCDEFIPKKPSVSVFFDMTFTEVDFRIDLNCVFGR